MRHFYRRLKKLNELNLVKLISHLGAMERLFDE